MNRRQNREPVFADEQDRQAFLDPLARYRERFELRLFHYCLVSNHSDLLVRLRDLRQVSRLMAGLLQANCTIAIAVLVSGQSLAGPIQECSSAAPGFSAKLRTLR